MFQKENKEVVCAPDICNHRLWYVFREDGQEVAVLTSVNLEIIKSSSKLTAKEKQCIINKISNEL